MKANKSLILVLVSLVSIAIVVLKASDRLIDLFWKKPSSFSGKELRSWPRDMDFKIPNPYSEQNDLEYHFFVTDQYGALKGARSSSGQLAWIFGDIRTANLTVSKEKRWPSLIQLTNLNFGFPLFNFFQLKDQISKLLIEIPFKPKHVFLGDGIGKWVFFGADLEKESWPKHRSFDLSPYWVWGKPAASHTFFEFLCFYWTSPFCQFRRPSQESAPIIKNIEPRWSGEDIKKRFNLAFESVSQVKTVLRQRDIGLIGLTTPYAKWERKWKRDANAMLKLKYAELSIPVIDIEKCFEELGNPDDLFKVQGSEVGTLSLSGNRVFAKCFDQLILNL
ncbi:MAG: hypothetical protein EBR01_08175 [Proteobacteria bacterium]|nr:hypothetical protein [Pseudomonadota bacterium]